MNHKNNNTNLFVNTIQELSKQSEAVILSAARDTLVDFNLPTVGDVTRTLSKLNS
jgi:hypothetical protein